VLAERRGWPDRIAGLPDRAAAVEFKSDVKKLIAVRRHEIA
jgi:hypothetical protein